ncbi:ATP-dependent DNA helicase RecG [Oscillospiraceae bacterium]|nr:ATP-dependent DNA helicase RecG [Oscillospiraceae bacterium]BDF73784.1 ATP-dependent DNA helicase RecG [Oscillospiraceae bacterium]
MALDLKSGVRELPGIGEARAKALEKLGLATVDDLLHYFPRQYEDRRSGTTIARAPEGEPVCIAAMVAETPRLSRIRKGLELTRAKVVDATGAMTVTFFNQSYVKDALRPGESYIFYGKVEGGGARRQMTNPVFERESAARFTGRIMPVYPLTHGVSNNLLAGLTLRCVEECAGAVPEVLPAGVRRAHALAAAEYAYRNIHFPEDEQALEVARRRLIFEELFYFACGLALLRGRREAGEGPAFSPAPAGDFEALLPFSLTGAQRRCVEEAWRDLASGRPMNRLVQGDVGSGKTAVAAACAWLAFRSGWQSALMAPTEILAEQHYRSLSAMLAPAGLRVGLLTGSKKAAEKRQIRAALAAGEIDLLVGTHAILSEGVEFSRLGLVVTDEQHRFGVAQRAALSEKAVRDPSQTGRRSCGAGGGDSLPPAENQMEGVPTAARRRGGFTPHVLVMSATPIPRTLALIIYGDLDVSVIDELPPGRSPVETFVVGEDKRGRMYNFVRRLVGEGRQAYIVCPMVGEGEEEAAGLKAVTEYAAELQQKIFPDLRVAFVHGKLKPREKEAVMAAFAAGESDVLVSTTVIEVGVDVPNAALMVVENAERFGLSQLHQLRGRVGRGEHQSYCVLMAGQAAPESRARLKVLSSTNDGFKISEEDLKLRGPGDFFGSRQHGLPQLGIADLAGDMRVLKEAQGAAEALLLEDPGLTKRSHRPLLARVRKLFADNPDIFN